MSKLLRVCVVGHVEWVDFIPLERFPRPGEVVHAGRSFSRAAGGGGVVAAALNELGAEVEFFTALGRDASGEAAAAQLRQRGISTHIAWRDAPTRRAVTMLEPEGERTIVTIGERLEPLGSDELPWGLVHGAAGVYFTAGDAAALKHAREAGFVVASPRGRSALEGTRPRIDALVFSSRDPAESEWARRVEKWARVLVATDGPRGGTWWGESQGSWDAVEPPAEPRDSYGCGDYFAAGFTFGLASGMPVEEAVRVGARWGAVALTRGGAP